MTNFTPVADVAPRALFAANGVQTAFRFTFPIFDAEDMEVWIDQARQSVGAYSISGIGVAVGGTVIFAVPPPAGARVTLRRRMGLKCEREFPDTAVEAWRLNNAFYYQTAVLQQVADDVALAVKRSFRSLPAADLTLPEPQAGRAIRWNDSGDGLVNTEAEVDALMAQATARAEAATAAAAEARSNRDAAALSANAAAAARSTCDADVVVTGADRSATAADRAAAAADRSAVQADRQAVESATALVTASAAIVQADAAAAASSSTTAQDAATAAAAGKSAAHTSELSAAGSAGAAHASEVNAAASASAAAASAQAAQQAAGIYTFSNVAVSGQPTVVADQTGDTLTVAAGSGIGITTNAASDTLTIGLADTELLALAGLTSAADTLPYFTGSGTAGLAVFGPAGRSLTAAADPAAQRAVLGLGSAATLSGGNSAANLPTVAAMHAMACALSL